MKRKQICLHPAVNGAERDSSSFSTSWKNYYDGISMLSHMNIKPLALLRLRVATGFKFMGEKMISNKNISFRQKKSLCSSFWSINNFFGKCSSKCLSRDTRTKINLNMRAWKCQSEGNVKKFYGIKNVSHKNLHKLLFLCFKMQNFVLSWVELKFLLELFSGKNLSSFESIKCWKFMTRAIKFIFA